MYLNEYAVTAYVGSNMYSRVHKIDAPSAGERREGKIHRNDPDFGSTLTVSNRDSQSDCWVDWKIMGQPCEFQVLPGEGRGACSWRGEYGEWVRVVGYQQNILRHD